MSKHRYVLPYLIPFLIFARYFIVLEGEYRLSYSFLFSGLTLIIINLPILFIVGGFGNNKRFSTFDTSSMVASHEENVQSYMKNNPVDLSKTMQYQFPFYLRYPHVLSLFGFLFLFITFIVN